MNEIVKPAGILLLIAAVAAMLLGFVHEITLEPIEMQKAKTESEAMQAVMPEADSFEVYSEEAVSVDGVNISKISKAIAGGEEIGYVVITEPGGFGGNVVTMVGVDSGGSVTGLRVTSHSETPGLGAVATDPSFYEQFTGMSGELAVTKDGGSVQAITSATITSRAVASGANAALKWVSENGGAN